MKLSLKWLSDHVDVADFFEKPMVLADKLTDAGLEVEEVTSLSETFKNVVVGQITKLGKHPDADKLTYCDVNVGDETLKIICGAQNHKEGDKVCVAKIGAVLPGDFKIKKSKIRGVESFGMLCSNSELGLESEKDKKSDGILILPKDAKVGEDFAKHAGLDDVTFEVNVTPNRADCLSHLGLAREVSTLFKRPLIKKNIKKPAKFEDKKSIVIELKDAELCPRYMGQMVYGVKVGPSPVWLKQKLDSVGLKSINNIVDITNYIMMDSGQPLHAFDVKHIDGDKIIIDTAVAGEAFKTLDGTDLKLSGSELTIRDSKKPLALAGVIGGVNSGVTETTTDVFVEAAHFIPSGVRKTSRSLGVDTDSSYRFSRGTDESNVDSCLEEAVSLICELAGGSANKEIVEAYPKVKSVSEIKISHDFVNSKLGFEVTVDQIQSTFDSLGFKSKKSGDTWAVTPSTYRWDIAIREDLVEEIGRLVGYNNIPEILPATSQVPQDENSDYLNFKRLRSELNGMGFHEAVHYNFYSGVDEVKWSEELLKWSSYTVDNAVEIKNPLSSDLSRMRSSMIPQFVMNYVKNWRLGAKSGNLFEIGKSHFKVKDSFKEHNILCVGYWREDESSVQSMESLLGVLSGFLEGWNINRWMANEAPNVPNLLHPNLSRKIIAEGKDLGTVFCISPAVTKDYKVPANFCGFEIDLDLFLKGQPRPKKFKEFSRFPTVTRDFSALVEKDFSYDDVYKRVKKTSGELLKSLDVHDVYQGDKIPDGKLSVTFRGQFQAFDKTLSEDELKDLQKKIMTELAGL
jgi:phenylalanyl-tRNA synthetase beta chain